MTEQKNYILAAEFLQNIVFINLQMNDEEKIQRLRNFVSFSDTFWYFSDNFCSIFVIFWHYYSSSRDFDTSVNQEKALLTITNCR